jgi:hypothetical protein
LIITRLKFITDKNKNNSGFSMWSGRVEEIEGGKDGRASGHSDILILLFVLVNNIPKFELCRIQ